MRDIRTGSSLGGGTATVVLSGRRVNRQFDSNATKPLISQTAIFAVKQLGDHGASRSKTPAGRKPYSGGLAGLFGIHEGGWRQAGNIIIRSPVMFARNVTSGPVAYRVSNSTRIAMLRQGKAPARLQSDGGQGCCGWMACA
jgi:hypothetical protein